MSIRSLFESSLDLKLMRNGFFTLSLIALLFMPLDLIRLSQKERADASVGGVFPSASLSQSSLESLSTYEEALKGSRIFGFVDAQASLPAIQSSIAELMKDLRLKGVVILDEPEAIIEDARTQKSTFVKEEDKIGELTVKEIKEGVVVLAYCGEEKELRIQ